MISIEIEVFDDMPSGLVVEDLCRKTIDHGYGRMDDKYKKHAPTSAVHATGHISVGETISGPLYSGIKIMVGGTMPCRQSALGDVQDLLFDDCLEKIDSLIKPTYLGLLTHLKEVRPQEMKQWLEELENG